MLVDVVVTRLTSVAEVVTVVVAVGWAGLCCSLVPEGVEGCSDLHSRWRGIA